MQALLSMIARSWAKIMGEDHALLIRQPSNIYAFMIQKSLNKALSHCQHLSTKSFWTPDFPFAQPSKCPLAASGQTDSLHLCSQERKRMRSRLIGGSKGTRSVPPSPALRRANALFVVPCLAKCSIVGCCMVAKCWTHYPSDHRLAGL